MKHSFRQTRNNPNKKFLYHSSSYSNSNSNVKIRTVFLSKWILYVCIVYKEHCIYKCINKIILHHIPFTVINSLIHSFTCRSSIFIFEIIICLEIKNFIQNKYPGFTNRTTKKKPKNYFFSCAMFCPFFPDKKSILTLKYQNFNAINKTKFGIRYKWKRKKEKMVICSSSSRVYTSSTCIKQEKKKWTNRGKEKTQVNKIKNTRNFCIYEFFVHSVNLRYRHPFV